MGINKTRPLFNRGGNIVMNFQNVLCSLDDKGNTNTQGTYNINSDVIKVIIPEKFRPISRPLVDNFIGTII